MRHESSSRPSKFYLKLESDKSLAVTWKTDTAKVAALFKDSLSRMQWLKSDKANELTKSGHRLKLEDGYIFKPKYGIVIDIDGKPVFDEYTMENSKCDIYEKTLVNEREYKIRVAVLNRAKHLNEEAQRILDKTKEMEYYEIEAAQECKGMIDKLTTAFIQLTSKRPKL